jgi:hypothetical protein
LKADTLIKKAKGGHLQGNYDQRSQELQAALRNRKSA